MDCGGGVNGLEGLENGLVDGVSPIGKGLEQACTVVGGGFGEEAEGVRAEALQNALGGCPGGRVAVRRRLRR